MGLSDGYSQKPINKYDPILKIRVSDEIMTILDNKLIELFTK